MQEAREAGEPHPDERLARWLLVLVRQIRRIEPGDVIEIGFDDEANLRFTVVRGDLEIDTPPLHFGDRKSTSPPELDSNPERN